MKTFMKFSAVILAGLFAISGCSQGVSPVTPSDTSTVEPAVSHASTSHSLLGLYTFLYDPTAGIMDVTHHRNANLHLNALKFLEPPPNLYLAIVPPIKVNGNILDVDISLTHPFLGLHQYTGFDVCGIVFTHGSHTGFADQQIVMAGVGDTRLLNADGYTRWWNPVEFPHGDKIFNYIDGMLGTPAGSADFNCTINGYKYFADGLGHVDPVSSLDPALRSMFSVGQKLVRHYTIDMSGGLIFNYAVDACWKQPVGIPPITAPDDFPPGANRPEAYNISVTELSNTLYFDESDGSAGGNLELQIDVWDHFNGSLNEVWCESLAGLPYTGADTPVGGNEVYSTYVIDIPGDGLTLNGEAELLITVPCEVVGYGNVLQDKVVSAYFIHSINISSDAPHGPGDGWALTWGGPDYDDGFCLDMDSHDNIYVVGNFRDTADFDPGSGECLVDSQGAKDIFLSKFNTTGQFQWVRTWGGEEYDGSWAVALDSSDCIYVTGYFAETVDFDPGSGVEEYTSNGHYDVFLSKFDADGNFLWVRTWGAGIQDLGRMVWIDNFDNIYVGGSYQYTVDFDPGDGVDEHVSNGQDDAYLSKFDSDGHFIWAVTWGGPDDDMVYSITSDMDGDLYIAGRFRDMVDFDPGGGTAESTSNGSYDAFLSKFNDEGIFQWVRTWGGSSGDYVEGVAVDTDGYVYAAGNFRSTVDFDPGVDTDEHTSNGNYDVFLSMFDSDGEFYWSLTWGGTGTDDSHWVSIYGDDYYVCGHFNGTLDIDPTDGVDIRTSNGSLEVYLSKFDFSGNFIWARTWGGGGSDYSWAVNNDSFGNVFVVGAFHSDVDFDPGPDEDIHSSNGGYDSYLVKFKPDGYW